MPSSFLYRFASTAAFQSIWEGSLHSGECFVPTPGSPELGEAVLVELAQGPRLFRASAEVIGLESDAEGRPGIRVMFPAAELPQLRAFASAVLGAAPAAPPGEPAAAPREAAKTPPSPQPRPDEAFLQTAIRPASPTPGLQEPAPGNTRAEPGRGAAAPVRLGDTNALPRITPMAATPGGVEARLEVGQVVDGRFQVEAHIGEGGMGEVYKATHVSLKRTVALKVLHRRLVSNPDAWARFQREAELVAQLEGPHVVRVFDFGRLSDGQPFLSMEFVEGQPLSALVEKGPLDVKSAVGLLVQVAEGLAEAHALGIVHRDLKPPNIMVGKRRDGRALAKILDFGIARLASAGQDKLTATGAVVGTPSYLAPEQASGGEIDARTDLYALGCVAYELLTGRVPFEAESLARLIMMHLQDKPKPLEAFRPALGETPALGTVVLKALEKDPSKRWQTVEAFSAALTDAVEDPSKPVARVPSGPVIDAPAQDDSWGVEQMPLISAPPANRTVDLKPAPSPLPPPGIGARPGMSGLTPAFSPGATAAGGGAKPGLSGLTPAFSPGATAAGGSAKSGMSGLTPAFSPGGATSGLSQPKATTVFMPGGADATDGRLGRLGEVLGQLNFPLSPDRVARCEQARAALPASLPIAWVLAAEPLRASDPQAFAQLLTTCTDVALDWGGVLDDLEAAHFGFVFFGLGAQARGLLAAQELRERLEALSDGAAPDGPSLRFGVSASRLRGEPDGVLEGDAIGNAKALLKRAAPGQCLLARSFANAVNDLVETKAFDDDVVQVVDRKPVPAKALPTVGFGAVASALDARVGALLKGEVVPVVVTGPRRAGRTQVAQEFAVRAQQQGTQVGFASGTRSGPGLNASAVTELVCQLTGVPLSFRAQGLPPVLERLGLSPSQREAVLVVTGVKSSPAPFPARQAAHALRLVMGAASGQRPQVYVFDGLDQCDEASVEVFRELCATRQRRELLVGFTTAEHAAAAFTKVHLVPLPSLSPADVDALLTAFLGNPPSNELRDTLLARSSGLPGVLVDFTLLTAERGALRPRGEALTLEGVVPTIDSGALPAARLKAVGTRVTRLLEAVAALGDAADGAAVARVLPTVAQAAWARASASRLMRSGGQGRLQVANGFEPVLPTVALFGQVPLASRLAQVLGEAAREKPALGVKVATLLSRSADVAKAGQLWKAVAERALQERDVVTLSLAQAGMAEVLAGHAHASSRQAVTARLELWARAAVTALMVKDVARARQAIDAGVELAETSQVSSAEHFFALARVLRFEGQLDAANEALEQALGLSKGGPAEAACLAELGELREAANDLVNAVDAYQQALSVADAFLPLAPWHGELDFRARLESRVGGVLMSQQQLARAKPFLTTANERWKAAGAALHSARVMANLGTLSVQSNAFKEATQWFGAAATTAESAGDFLFQARQLVSLCRVLSKLVDTRLPQAAQLALSVATGLHFEDGVKAAKGFLEARR